MPIRAGACGAERAKEHGGQGRCAADPGPLRGGFSRGRQRIRSLAGMSWIRQEPVRFATLFLSFAVAVIALLRVFGIALTDGQVDAITEMTRAGVEILLFVIVGETARKKVSPLPVVLVLAAAFAVSTMACTKQQVMGAVNALGATATQLLCAESRAEERGITVEEALQVACATEDQWAPWKRAADEARTKGRAAARAAERE